MIFGDEFSVEYLVLWNICFIDISNGFLGKCF